MFLISRLQHALNYFSEKWLMETWGMLTFAGMPGPQRTSSEAVPFANYG